MRGGGGDISHLELNITHCQKFKLRKSKKCKLKQNDEVCLLEIRLCGGDLQPFGCFYRSPTPTSMSEQNNEDLNTLLRCVSRKSDKWFVGDFNYRDTNWVSWTTPNNEDSNEAICVETIRDCYLH